jgi:DNA-binding transcriptional ArsR family regulator
LPVAARSKFTRIPKTTELIGAGVPVEAIPTYTCLADHASNRTGECWPSMARLAQILGKSVRTVQRHLHALKECGLIEFVERRRHRGRFSSYLYRVLHIARATTGHGRRARGRGPIRGGTKRSTNVPHSPQQKGLTEGYWHLFGQQAPPGAQEEHDRVTVQGREEEARCRMEGFGWLFGR